VIVVTKVAKERESGTELPLKERLGKPLAEKVRLIRLEPEEKNDRGCRKRSSNWAKQGGDVVVKGRRDLANGSTGSAD